LPPSFQIQSFNTRLFCPGLLELQSSSQAVKTVLTGKLLWSNINRLKGCQVFHRQSDNPCFKIASQNTVKNRGGLTAVIRKDRSNAQAGHCTVLILKIRNFVSDESIGKQHGKAVNDLMI
jgi:hypothetical protein